MIKHNQTHFICIVFFMKRSRDEIIQLKKYWVLNKLSNNDTKNYILEIERFLKNIYNLLFVICMLQLKYI